MFIVVYPGSAKLIQSWKSNNIMCQYFYYVNRPKDNKYLVVFIHTSKTVEL